MHVPSEENQILAQLVQRIIPQGRLLRAWPLQGGISAEMTALEVIRPDGRPQKMILRRPSPAALSHNPHTAEDEYRVLQLACANGLAAPSPYYLDPSGQIFPAPYLVIEYIEGRPEFAPPDTPSFTHQLSAHLARIHRVDCSRPDASFLPKQTGELDSVPGKGPAVLDPSFAVERIRHALGPAWPPAQRNASVLLHGDYWPGNILWRDSQLAAVIDWEDAACGDPLYDLAISRLDILWIYGSDAMRSFTRQYQSMQAIDYANLPCWDLNAALRLARLAGPDLAGWAAFFHPFGRPDITERTILEYYSWFIDQALDRLAA